MKFILSNLNYLYVGVMIEFSTCVARFPHVMSCNKGCRQDRQSKPRQIILSLDLGILESKDILIIDFLNNSIQW